MTKPTSKFSTQPDNKKKHQAIIQYSVVVPQPPSAIYSLIPLVQQIVVHSSAATYLYRIELILALPQTLTTNSAIITLVLHLVETSSVHAAAGGIYLP